MGKETYLVFFYFIFKVYIRVCVNGLMFLFVNPRRIFHDEDAAYSRYTPSARPLHTENDDDGFLQYLENVQQELSEGNYSKLFLTLHHVADPLWNYTLITVHPKDSSG